MANGDFLYFVFDSIIPMRRITSPIMAIVCPYDIHCGFAYMKDDSGPTTARPCR